VALVARAAGTVAAVGHRLGAVGHAIAARGRLTAGLPGGAALARTHAALAIVRAQTAFAVGARRAFAPAVHVDLAPVASAVLAARLDASAIAADAARAVVVVVAGSSEGAVEAGTTTIDVALPESQSTILAVRGTAPRLARRDGDVARRDILARVEGARLAATVQASLARAALRVTLTRVGQSRIGAVGRGYGARVGLDRGRRWCGRPGVGLGGDEGFGDLEGDVEIVTERATRQPWSEQQPRT
jgi:hypothetical protein